jgi:hypothetical protein
MENEKTKEILPHCSKENKPRIVTNYLKKKKDYEKLILILLIL